MPKGSTRRSKSKSKSKGSRKTRHSTNNPSNDVIYQQIKIKLDEIDELAKKKYVPSELLEPGRNVTHTPELYQNSPKLSAAVPEVSLPEVPKRASRPAPEGLKKFNEFIKDYHAKHPELSYTDALLQGSDIWKQKKSPAIDMSMASNSNMSMASTNASKSASKSNNSANSAKQNSLTLSTNTEDNDDEDSEDNDDETPGRASPPKNIPTLVPNSMRLKQQGKPEEFD